MFIFSGNDAYKIEFMFYLVLDSSFQMEYFFIIEAFGVRILIFIVYQCYQSLIFLLFVQLRNILWNYVYGRLQQHSCGGWNLMFVQLSIFRFSLAKELIFLRFNQKQIIIFFLGERLSWNPIFLLGAIRAKRGNALIFSAKDYHGDYIL